MCGIDMDINHISRLLAARFPKKCKFCIRNFLRQTKNHQHPIFCSPATEFMRTRLPRQVFMQLQNDPFSHHLHSCWRSRETWTIAKQIGNKKHTHEIKKKYDKPNGVKAGQTDFVVALHWLAERTQLKFVYVPCTSFSLSSSSSSSSLSPSQPMRETK